MRTSSRTYDESLVASWRILTPPRGRLELVLHAERGVEDDRDPQRAALGGEVVDCLGLLEDPKSRRRSVT
jgi:hypothetical protein